MSELTVTDRRWIFADREVRRWALAAGVSQLGDQVWLVALAWTAVRLGGPGLAAVAVASASLPRAVLMLVGGGLADRVSPRRLMVGCDIARTLVLLVAFAVLQGVAPSGVLLIAISACFGIADAAYMPASNSFPVQLVRREQLVALAGARQLIGRVALLAGAPLGGLIVATGGLTLAVATDAVSFALIGVVLCRLRPRFSRPRSVGNSLLADVRGGLAYIWHTPTVRDLTIALSGLNVFVTPAVAVGLAQRASAHGWGSSRLGILTGLIGAGAALGTVAVLRWRPKRPIRAGLIILLAQAAALASLGVTSFGEAAIATLTIGVTAGLASPLLAGAFQETVVPTYLGRANSVVSVSDAALMPLALVLFGWLGTHAGIASSCAAFGTGFGCLLTYSIIRTGTQRRTPEREASTEKLPLRPGTDESPSSRRSRWTALTRRA